MLALLCCPESQDQLTEAIIGTWAHSNIYETQGMDKGACAYDQTAVDPVNVMVSGEVQVIFVSVICKKYLASFCQHTRAAGHCSLDGEESTPEAIGGWGQAFTSSCTAMT